MPRDVSDVVRDYLLESGLPKVYVGDAPALDLECVALRLTDGYPSTYYFGKVSVDEPLIEVIIRTVDYELGKSWYQQIKEVLDQWEDAEDGILSCLLTGSPGYLGRDVDGYNEWHMLFHISV